MLLCLSVCQLVCLFVCLSVSVLSASVCDGLPETGEPFFLLLFFLFFFFCLFFFQGGVRKLTPSAQCILSGGKGEVEGDGGVLHNLNQLTI